MLASVSMASSPGGHGVESSQRQPGDRSWWSYDRKDGCWRLWMLVAKVESGPATPEPRGSVARETVAWKKARVSTDARDGAASASAGGSAAASSQMQFNDSGLDEVQAGERPASPLDGAGGSEKC